MDGHYPKPTSPAATRRMRSNRRSDTDPEIALRSSLHRHGLRFRKDYPIRLSNGKIVRVDIAFTRQKLAVFVDGCFWHSCPKHGSSPKSNRHYWIPKLKDNVIRDRANDRELRAIDWQVLRVWEHVDHEVAKMRVLSALDLIAPSPLSSPSIAVVNNGRSEDCYCKPRSVTST